MGTPTLGVVAIVGLTLIARADAGLAFFAVGLMGAPLAGVLNPSGLPYPRYLLVSVALLQVMGGYLWARGLAVGQRTAVQPRSSCWFCSLAARSTPSGLSQSGRGQYQLALLNILNSGLPEPTGVSSNHDFRNATVIKHNARALASEVRRQHVKVIDVKEQRRACTKIRPPNDFTYLCFKPLHKVQRHQPEIRSVSLE